MITVRGTLTKRLTRNHVSSGNRSVDGVCSNNVGRVKQQRPVSVSARPSDIHRRAPRIVCEHWNMALIPPTERRFVPPSPEEQERLRTEALVRRAELDAASEALIPAKRSALQAGPVLRDFEAAVGCGCSCHPKPASPDSHDGGVTCYCQQTKAERKAAFESCRFHGRSLGSRTNLGRTSHRRISNRS